MFYLYANRIIGHSTVQQHKKHIIMDIFLHFFNLYVSICARFKTSCAEVKLSAEELQPLNVAAEEHKWNYMEKAEETSVIKSI